MPNEDLNGFINLLKPTNMTSSDAVVIVRGILRKNFGAVKVGHFGTLDPGAAGVLPIAIGKATKLFDFNFKDKKTYRAAFSFGQETDTLDSYGCVTNTSDNIPSENDVLDLLNNIIGKHTQVPPQYSAKLVNGARAYDLARKGISVDLKGREIEIYNMEYLGKNENTFYFDIMCSAGTYIRSIVRDMAYALNTVGFMSSLIRTEAGIFSIKEAVTLENLQTDLLSNIITVDRYLENFCRYDVDEKFEKPLINGVKLKLNNLSDGSYAVYLKNDLFGVAKAEKGILNVCVRF